MKEEKGKIKNEPNKALQPKRLLVTDPALQALRQANARLVMTLGRNMVFPILASFAFLVALILIARICYRALAWTRVCGRVVDVEAREITNQWFGDASTFYFLRIAYRCPRSEKEVEHLEQAGSGFTSIKPKDLVTVLISPTGNQIIAGISRQFYLPSFFIILSGLFYAPTLFAK